MHDLPSLLLAYGINLKQTGNEYKCLCFAHDDHNPSMSIYINGTGKHVAHCYTCGYHEDVIGTYCHFNGLDPQNPQDFLKAKAALEGDEFHTGKPFAQISVAPKPPKLERTFLIPPDDDLIPKMDYLTDQDGIKFGDPVEVGTFHTPEGKVWYYEARYIVKGRKEPRCFTYGKRGISMPARWECAFPPKPNRPLYGLDEVAKNGKQIAVFEGWRKAAKAQPLIPGIACVAWIGGANGWKYADWTAVAGRAILLFPDADETGRKAMNALAQHLVGKSGVVHIVDDVSKSDGWDICDADWTPDDFIAWAKANKSKPIEAETEEPAPEDMSEYDLPPMPEDTQPEIPVEAYEPDHTLQWSEPLDVFTEIQAPQVKSEQLPAPIAAWIEDVAGVIGVDPSMLALPAIVSCAAMLHDGIQIQPEANNPGWKESARLWGALVGDPSSKKSPAMSKVLSIVKKIDAECHDKEGKLKYEFSLKEKAHSANEKAYIERLQKGDDTNPPIKPELPEIPRAYAQDCTVEALRDVLKHSSRGVLAERDELTGWFGSMDQYKSGGKGGSDRANWLELYNGGSRRIDRVGAGSVFVKNWSASLIGGIQPDPLKAIAGQMNEDGLLQRFMVVYGRAGKQGNEQAPSIELETQYRRIVRHIWEILPNHEPVLLSPEANTIRKQIVARAYELIEMKFISNSMVAHLGKWEGLSARLMLTYHAIECATLEVHPQSCAVSGATASKVKAFMLDFLLPHAIQFYMDIMAGSDTNKHFVAVANLILAKHPHEITLRQITHGWIGWRHASEQVQMSVINRLVDAGWIQTPIGSRLAHNRRLATRYIINPMLADKFSRRAKAELLRREEARQIIEALRKDVE